MNFLAPALSLQVPAVVFAAATAPKQRETSARGRRIFPVSAGRPALCRHASDEVAPAGLNTELAPDRFKDFWRD
jgi:hypothetical protein